MYEDLYFNIEDTGAYLKRIDMDPETFRPDLSHLNELLYKHHRNVPFDNLNVWDRAELPSLGIPDLFKKIVVDRRGGYCFEMNGLLESALRTLGYDCYGVEIRIVRGRDFLPAYRHRGVIVRLDGKKLFCDVGLGFRFFPEAAPFNEGYCRSGYKVECKDGMCELWVKSPNGTEEKELVFPDRPVLAIDYLNPNIACALDPSSTFRQRFTAVIMTPEGYRKTLLCNCPSPRKASQDAPVFTVNIKDGAKTVYEESFCGTAELTRQLKDGFGIVYEWE